MAVLQINLDYNGKDVVCEFPYHPRLVSVIQVSAPAPRWDARKKNWKLPANELTAKWVKEFPTLFPDIKLTTTKKLTKYLKSRSDTAISLATIKDLAATRLKSVDGAEYFLAPYAHQKEALRFLVRRAKAGVPHAALFYEMGTGKTKVIIDATKILKWKKILVAVPKTVILSWRREIKKNLPKGSYRIIDATRGNVRKRAEAIADVIHLPSRLTTFVLVNYDALRIKHMMGTLEAVEWDCITLDESTYIKTPKALRSKAAIKLGESGKFRVIMTGTPVTNNYLDLFAQFKFLDSSILGIPTFTAFKATYAQYDYPFKDPKRRNIPILRGYRHIDDLLAKISLHSMIKTIDECLDLPEKAPPIIRSVSLDDFPEAKKAYHEMRKHLLTLLEDGTEVSASNILTQLLRLQQITSGFVTDEDGTEISLGEAPKITALLEFVDEIGDKEQVVVWARFRHDIREIERALATRGSVGVVTGSVTGKHRDKVINDFEAGKHRFFVATPRTCGFGIDLISARYTIWYSPSFSLEERYQADARTRRAGQKRRTFYVDLIVEGTIDELILTAIHRKSSLLDYVMDVGAKNLGTKI